VAEESDENSEENSEDDAEFINWLDRGEYGYIDPNSQFEFDDEVERAYHTDPWPWGKLLGKWRERAGSLWRLMKHWLFFIS
jgi:hypothetical protein